MRVYVLQFTIHFDAMYGQYAKNSKSEIRKYYYSKEERDKFISYYQRVIKDTLHYTDVIVYFGEVEPVDMNSIIDAV